MKDIYTILGEIGLTVPEEKKSAFDTAIRENYKTVSDNCKNSENKNGTPLPTFHLDKFILF